MTTQRDLTPRPQADEEFSWLHALNPPAWHTDALCAEVGGDLFFPEVGESTSEAKALCARCDVREVCLEAAIERDEPFGIFGGLAPRTRRKVKQQREAS